MILYMHNANTNEDTFQEVRACSFQTDDYTREVTISSIAIDAQIPDAWQDITIPWKIAILYDSGHELRSVLR